jgi:HD-GYP domain-containing protein (c-di-GMP phosphodiesterase class II)
MNARVDALVTLLARGIAQRGLYFAEHPNVRACAHELARDLAQTIAGSESGFFLGAVEGRLIHEGRMLLGASIVGHKVASCLDRLHSGGLLFRRGVEARELSALFTIAVEQSEPIDGGLAAARELLVSRDVQNIELSPRYEDEDWFGRNVKGSAESDEDGKDLADLIPVYQSLFEVVETSHGRATGDHGVDIDGARAVSERFLAATSAGSPDMMQLVRYTDADSYTVGHSVRVALLCVLVGQHLGLPKPRLNELATAGLLHDVGKAKVPPEILYKAGRLDPDELRIMRIHPDAGAKILIESGDASSTTVCTAWGHHVRHDLRGYPNVPGWAVQGEATALLQACDVFEALTAVRPYKRAVTPLRAFEIMFADPGAFHPGALRALVQTLGIYPPGSRITLSDGSRAIVMRAGEKPDRPLVRVTRDAEGVPLDHDAQPVVDLSGPHGGQLAVADLLSGGAESALVVEEEGGDSETLVTVEADPAAGD